MEFIHIIYKRVLDGEKHLPLARKNSYPPELVRELLESTRGQMTVPDAPFFRERDEVP
jgi:hypothetical protein